MLSLLYDSAARVQELVDIEIGDLYLYDKTGAISEPFITLRGKGAGFDRQQPLFGMHGNLISLKTSLNKPDQFCPHKITL